MAAARAATADLERGPSDRLELRPKRGELRSPEEIFLVLSKMPCGQKLCAGFWCLFFLVCLIFIPLSVQTLGPEEQLVIITEGGAGKEVVNGSKTFVVNPFLSTELRRATRLSPQQYAKVKNIRTGLPRHEEGPMLLFLGPWDELVGVEEKFVLQARQYVRLVDSFTGQVRVEVGPQRISPEPYESAPKGIQEAILVRSTVSVLLLNRTSGRKRSVQEEGIFVPGPWEEVVAVRNATVLLEKEYAIVRDTFTGEYRHEDGPKLLVIGAYDEVVRVRPKIVLQKAEYVRLVDQFTGFARVVVGPALLVPNPSEDGPGGIEHEVMQAIIISSQLSVVLLNKTSGQKYEVREEGMFTPGPYEQILEVRNATVLKSQEYAVVKNDLTGMYVHYPGPQRLFVGAYEQLVRVLLKVVLQKQEYVRLVDRRTGEEAVISGPQTVVPDPAQCEKDYTRNCNITVEEAVVMKADVSALTLNRTSGMKRIVRAEESQGLFVPGPYEELVEVRQATVLKEQEYAFVQDVMSGSYRHESGPQLLFAGAYDQLGRVLLKVVLQQQEYVRLVNRHTGAERVQMGPQTLVPEPEECEKDYTSDCSLTVQQAVVMSADVAVLTLNRTSGVKRVVRADSGGIFTPSPYEEIIEVRQATVLNQQEYAVIEDKMDGSRRHALGPQLLHIEAYEELLEVTFKVVLQQFEYIRLVNEQTGVERVKEGPLVLVPGPMEKSIVNSSESKTHHEMVQHAILIDMEHAILVLNQATGLQQLNTTEGMWVPAPYEHFVERRPRIRVMANEAIVVRDYDGELTVYDGTSGGAGTSFFLQPRSQIVRMTWTAYGEPAEDATVEISSVPMEKIDMRIQRTFFSYVVSTNDNVRLHLMGAIFWRVTNVTQMVLGTEDPSGDVWHHARSSFIQAVSNTTFNSFMGSFNRLAAEAYQRDAADSDGFYAGRGVQLLSMEVTRFEAVDEETQETLRSINEETINQITLLRQQEGENAVKAAKMRSDIALEEEETLAELSLELQKTDLINARSANNLLEKKVEAEIDAHPFAQHAKIFIHALNESGVSLPSSLGLYQALREAEYHNRDTQNLASGGATLFLTSQDVKLNVRDLNLGYNSSAAARGEHDHEL